MKFKAFLSLGYQDVLRFDVSGLMGLRVSGFRASGVWGKPSARCCGAAGHVWGLGSMWNLGPFRV